MTNILLFVLLGLAGVILVLQVLARRNRAGFDAGPLEARFDALEKAQERAERGIKDEFGRSREEGMLQGKNQREELQVTLRCVGEQMVKTSSEMAHSQREQLATFAAQLGQSSEAAESRAKQLREELAASARGFNDSIFKQMSELAALQKRQMDGFVLELQKLREGNEAKIEGLKIAVEAKLSQIQQDNAIKLEEMRRTVDERLQGALEKRLGESFKLVSDRLEQVHKGLGEMQSLASGVGDLKKVLTNVKIRGTWGEMQLGNLLEQMLTADQYERNVITRQGGSERVEFAVKLPGRDDDAQKVVWLPIDAKFPKEDYERIVDASERADAAALEDAARQLEVRIKAEARNIRDKYIDPPHTTDFGILFLPTEGLYAEALRRPGLSEALQRDFRVTIAGPTTLAALLNSLQMGFRSLAIQKRSGEVWTVLGAVKTEFGKFGDVIDKVQKKLLEASNVIDGAAIRTRAIERKLKNVHAATESDAAAVLGASADLLGEPEELRDSAA